MANSKTNTQSKTNSNKIPVYGSAKDIVADLRKMAKEKVSSASKIPQAVQKNVPSSSQIAKASKKNPFTLLLIIALVAAGIIIVALTISKSTLLTKLDTRRVLLPSEIDQQSQEKIKGITNYDWQSFTKGSKKGTQEEKLAALLLFYKEEDYAFKLFSTMERGASINQQEKDALQFAQIDQNITKDNIILLLNNMNKLWELYEKKGVTEAKIHFERIKILKEYFGKYEVGDDSVPKEADGITAGFRVAENQQDFMKLLIQRFNIFINTVRL